MRISRIQIQNFRNFHNLDLKLSDDAVIVGENKIGKSNLIYALRLILDPSLPDSARQLKEEDFWDGLARPLTKDDVITVSVEFADFEDNLKYLATLGECPISAEPMVSRLTYVFGAIGAQDDDPIKESDYDFYIYEADKPETRIGTEFRRRLPLDLLPALRDAEGDLANWRRSPLRPLLDEVSGLIDPAVLSDIADEIARATDAVTQTSEVSALATEITGRLTEMVGTAQGQDMTLGFSPTEPNRLLRALRLFIDHGKRGIGDASLGSANLLYLALKTLELEQIVRKGKRDHTFLAIEEPEAHLHPHLQRLVYRDFLRRRTHLESSADPERGRPATSVIMTTHSPHIVSVSPLNSLVRLRKAGDGSTEGTSTALLGLEDSEREDLERYLDVTRGELLFAKGILLVEGDAELFVLPALGKLIGYDLDELGITVCSVSGTNFAPYIKLLAPSGLNIPFAVMTDLDPQADNTNLGEARVLMLLKLLASPADLAGKNVQQKLALAAEKGLFLNEYTFEVDLFRCGRHKSMGKTLIELAVSEPAKARARQWIDDPTKLDPRVMLRDIGAIGKGRFAQRLAANLRNKECPPYIKNALDYVAARCQ